MDLSLLRTFVAVHRAGSFTRAAQLLGLSQPAVTAQIRSLERQFGRPLFLRLPRGVTPTSVGDQLAHKVAPHLDALAEIAQSDLGESAGRSLHLAGPRDFTAYRVLPALAPLVAEGFELRVAFGPNEENLNGLAAAHHDLVIAPLRPRGRLLAATPLCDEQDVLVASPAWAARLGTGPAAQPDQAALEQVPVVDTDEDLPFLTRYWSAVFDAKPSVAGSLVVPDLRAVLEAVRAGAGTAALPHYLCAQDLAAGSLIALLAPPVPPLRTFFLVTRVGTVAKPHIARVRERLLRAAATW